MQTLGRIRWLSSLVLVWFAMTLGAASASALLKQTPPLGHVCTSAGAVAAQVDLDGLPSPETDRSAGCPLCSHLAIGLVPVCLPSMAAPCGHFAPLCTSDAGPLAPPTAAPLPARGPPQA